ncbi:hypothetical protein PHMEG_00013222 [Phytophthora megakarya]|uniref:Uncharacterized protein n=1 Tax=Phytophthora megakarya TaxID=4795 RepID=A0A225W8G4_9STRA|nr:hypothetical protein PHMEG_00013222 [Phytophthora megakarya]
MTKNSDICRVLYASLPDNYSKCKHCGTVRRQQPSSGYGNLISNLRDEYPEYETDYIAHSSSLASNLQSFSFVSDKIANIYHWIEWVVDRNMPLLRIRYHVRPLAAFTAMFRRNDEKNYDLLALASFDEAD